MLYLCDRCKKAEGIHNFKSERHEQISGVRQETKVSSGDWNLCTSCYVDFYDFIHRPT